MDKDRKFAGPEHLLVKAGANTAADPDQVWRETRRHGTIEAVCVNAPAERSGELLALMAVLGRAGTSADVPWMIQEIGRLKEAATTLAATEEALTKGDMTPARGTSIP